MLTHDRTESPAHHNNHLREDTLYTINTKTNFHNTTLMNDIPENVEKRLSGIYPKLGYYE